jgi:hypothetical protein
MPATAAAIHLHWCPRCDTTWDCSDAFSSCARGGSVVILDHCAQPLPEDDLDAAVVTIW